MTEATNNVEYVKSLYEAFANGDVPTVLAAMDNDIEWNEAEGNPYDLGHPFVGPSAVVEGVFARNRERHRRLRNPPGAVYRPGGHRRDAGSLLGSEGARHWRAPRCVARRPADRRRRAWPPRTGPVRSGIRPAFESSGPEVGRRIPSGLFSACGRVRM